MLDKTEEIQIQSSSIKSLWLQGKNSETQTVRDILSIIKATQQLEQLVETYWIYFEGEDKSKLEEMAYLI